ncbi:EAL domain-containing protein [Trinickia caryophylli]|nr:EAL domain-containing protein [Trinickia caryophylli]PMS14305.1 EAL domain-containing protein [Trinickia caryophylli]TRX17854.1 EAL domain-containing protein [Trinickia caryophylli]WQE11378.1 EAL domain-containing protein [Trinickia caryophylli]GLU32536.1 EAL domain-containing protein [Trinickia caryophylli]
MAAKRELTLAEILPHLQHDAAGWYVDYQAVRLRSAFQPVVSITHKRIVGYEALVRATDGKGQPISPPTLFAQTPRKHATFALDRLVRCVHFANFVEHDMANAWLFVNAPPGLFRSGWPYGSFIDELCAHFSLPHRRVVIELLEEPAADEAVFERTVEALRRRDLLIAIDDFGTGFSNFDRIWRMRPDIVKLDRSLVARMAAPGADGQFAAQLVTMLHRAGAMVLGEGVETDDELVTLLEADVDFVQGFWLGQPRGSPVEASRGVSSRIETMWSRFRERAGGAPRLTADLAQFERAVLAGASLYKATRQLAVAAGRTFESPLARRVFVTDAQGDQYEASIAANPEEAVDRLSPLFPDTGCNWSRRLYFKRALAAPGRVAVMGPHYSLTLGKDTYTGAVTVDIGEQMHVYCVDFLLDAPPGEASPRAPPP